MPSIWYLEFVADGSKCFNWQVTAYPFAVAVQWKRNRAPMHIDRFFLKSSNSLVKFTGCGLHWSEVNYVWEKYELQGGIDG